MFYGLEEMKSLTVLILYSLFATVHSEGIFNFDRFNLSLRYIVNTKELCI